MTVAVFAERAFRPGRAQLAGWERFGLRWVGWNGEEFDLRNTRGGVFVTTEGLLGLHNPAWESYVSESPATAGRRRTGTRVLARSVTLPVYLFNDDGTAEWAVLYRRFFGSFHAEKPGRLIVDTPSGRRELYLYEDSEGAHTMSRDPLYEGRMRFALALTAEDPWFYGETVERSWEQAAPEPFFGSDGNLHVSSGGSLEAAQLVNPGDAPAWVEWTVQADDSSSVSVTIELDGGTIGVPPVPAGQTLRIITDPAVQLATIDDEDVTDTIDPWDQGPVPERDTTPITLTVTGLGKITARFRPRYLRWL